MIVAINAINSVNNVPGKTIVLIATNNIRRGIVLFATEDINSATTVLGNHCAYGN